MSIACIECRGTGSKADFSIDDDCPDCKGTGRQVCEVRGCKEDAIAFNDDGGAMCEDCLAEWMLEEGERDLAEGDMPGGFN